MTSLQFSRHAQVRSQQRSLSSADMETVWRLGTVTGPNRVVLTNADIDREVRAYKAEITRLERLRGVQVVSDGDVVITAFHTSQPKQKRSYNSIWREQ